jgi:hypothetical protein
MQRRPDELIRDSRTMELGGIDVIDAEFRGAPQSRDRLAVVSGRPEYPGPGSCMAPKPMRDTVAGPGR